MAGAARSPRTEVLRDVLHPAFAVAQKLAEEGRPLPPGLRPMLTMKRLAPKALDTIDRAGDDEDFRAAVSEHLEDQELSPAARLWLDRPDGWQDEIEVLAAERGGAADEREARRSLRREQRAREKAEKARSELESEVVALRSELDRLRAERTDQAESLAELDRRLTDTESARARAVRELAEARVQHQRTVEDLRSLQAEVTEAAAQQAEIDAERAGGDEASDSGQQADSGEPDRTENPGPSGADEQRPATLPPGAADAMISAAGAAAELARTLGAAVAAFAAVVPAPGIDPDTQGESRAASGAHTPARPGQAPRPSVTRPRRQRAALPFAIHDDSAEAAAYLVRQPGTVLLVDGYNFTLGNWADRSLPDQRERLVNSLDELEARVGVAITVVFDGVQESLRQSRSRRVRVMFTAANVEADDVILERIDCLPADRPVVVASDDGRVRDGSWARGAHTISIEQLRSVIT